MTRSPKNGAPKNGPTEAGPTESATSASGIAIHYLADRPEAVPLLAVWFRQEWRTHFGRYAQAEVEAEIREGMQRDALPLTLVALSLPGAASTPPPDDTTGFCGTATLRAESFGELDDVGEEFEELGDIRGDIRGPWLGGLYIVPERRGRGIALALLDRGRAEARALGHAHLYAGTATAGPLFERAGWTALHQLPWHGALVTIYGTALE